MNIKDSYIHNGTAVLKDVKVENSVLKKILAGKDANDAYLGWETVCDLTGIKPKAAGTADKVGHKLTFSGGVTGTWDGSADKTVTIPTKSSWNYDDVYLKLTGNGTTNPLTGTIYIKDVNGIILNSKDKDLNIWEVYGNSGAWASQYGFNLQYLGTGLGNNNDLVLWAHNQAGTHVETYRVKQDGTFIFKAAPKVGTNIMYHAGNLTASVIGGLGILSNNISGNAATANFFVGCNNTITVAGDANTYYPVMISTTTNKKSPNIITVWKDLGSKTASYPGNHPDGSSSMLYRYDIRNCYWDGNGGYCTTLDARYMYARLVSETMMLYNGVGNFCIWLRGGGTEYNINTSWYISPSDINIYYSSTNVGSSTYPVTIAPRTDIGNEGVFNTITIPCRVIYASSADSATTSTYASNVGSSGTAGTNYVTASKVIAACNWYDTMISSDSDTVINRWSEIVAFVAGFKETPDLATFLSNNYLAKAGGTMTGPLKWKDNNALPQQTYPQYFLCIDAFDAGGTTKLADKADTLNALTGLTSTAIGDSDEPVYWNGAKFVKAGAYPTKASWNYDDRYLKLDGGKITGPVTFEMSNDRKIYINNSDDETYWSLISFQQKGTEYGTLGTAGSTDLQWNGHNLYHAGNLTASVIGGLGILSNNISGNAATATNAENISSIYPQLAASLEADEINVKRLIAWNNWGEYGYMLEAAIDFNWYETHNLFGVIRGNDKDSAGFGWMYSSDGSTYTPIARLSPSGQLYLAASLTISGAISGVTDITASGHAKVNSLKTQYICIECDNNGNTAGRGSEINNYDGPLYLQHNTSNNCVICGGGGNVGIGTTSPSYKLHVVGDIYTTTGFKKEGSSDSYVLLGGGGHKAISDFATASHTHSNYIERLAWWNDGDSHNANDLLSGTTFAYHNHSNCPTTGTIVAFNCINSIGYPLQLQGNYYGEELWFRNRNGDKGTWNAWRYVIHSGNISSQSVNYATSAGSVERATFGDSSNGPQDANAMTSNGLYYYSSNGPTINAHNFATGDAAMYVQAYNSSWVSQIAQDYRSGKLAVRSRNNGTWQPWRRIAFADSDYVVSADKIHYEPEHRKFTRIDSGYSWDAQAYSVCGYKECRITYKISQTGTYIMVGLNSDPTTDASFQSIDYCWYTQIGGNLSIRENGTDIGSISGHTTYTVGDELIVEYSCGQVRYYHNGVLCRTVARIYGSPLYFDSSFYTAGSIENVVFEPIHDSLDFVQTTASYSLSNAAWTNTITLPTTAGSYILNIVSGNSTLTGVFSIGASDNAKDEISLHLHGNGPRLYARTNGTTLQLSSNDTSATSRSVTIKYRRII